MIKFHYLSSMKVHEELVPRLIFVGPNKKFQKYFLDIFICICVFL